MRRRRRHRTTVDPARVRAGLLTSTRAAAARRRLAARIARAKAAR